MTESFTNRREITSEGWSTAARCRCRSCRVLYHHDCGGLPRRPARRPPASHGHAWRPLRNCQGALVAGQAHTLAIRMPCRLPPPALLPLLHSKLTDNCLHSNRHFRVAGRFPSRSRYVQPRTCRPLIDRSIPSEVTDTTGAGIQVGSTWVTSPNIVQLGTSREQGAVSGNSSHPRTTSPILCSFFPVDLSPFLSTICSAICADTLFSFHKTT